MRRHVVLALAGALVLGLGACGGGDSSGSDPSEGAPPTSAETAGVDAPETADTAAVTVPEATGPVVVALPEGAFRIKELDTLAQEAGLAVEFMEWESPAPLASDSVPAHLAVIDGAAVGALIAHDLLAPLPAASLPMADAPVAGDDSQDYSRLLLNQYTGFVVDTEEVKAPKSWEGFFDFVMENPRRATVLAGSSEIVDAGLFSVGAQPCTFDTAQQEATTDLLADVLNEIDALNPKEVLPSLIAGRVDAALIGSGAARLAQEHNQALRFVYPKEGASWLQRALVAPSSQPLNPAVEQVAQWVWQLAQTGVFTDMTGWAPTPVAGDTEMDQSLQKDHMLFPTAKQRARLVPMQPCEALMDERVSLVLTVATQLS